MGEITTVRSNGYMLQVICYMYDDQEVYNSFEENEYLV